MIPSSNIVVIRAHCGWDEEPFKQEYAGLARSSVDQKRTNRLSIAGKFLDKQNFFRGGANVNRAHCG